MRERGARERGAAHDLAAKARKIERLEREERERGGRIERRAPEQLHEARFQRAQRRRAVRERGIAHRRDVAFDRTYDRIEQRRIAAAADRQALAPALEPLHRPTWSGSRPGAGSRKPGSSRIHGSGAPPRARCAIAGRSGSRAHHAIDGCQASGIHDATSATASRQRRRSSASIACTGVAGPMPASHWRSASRAPPSSYRGQGRAPARCGAGEIVGTRAERADMACVRVLEAAGHAAPPVSRAASDATAASTRYQSSGAERVRRAGLGRGGVEGGDLADVRARTRRAAPAGAGRVAAMLAHRPGPPRSRRPRLPGRLDRTSAPRPRRRARGRSLVRSPGASAGRQGRACLPRNDRRVRDDP
jgi:hypothetical protein